MDWLANFIANLPLDEISDRLSELTRWWSNLVDGVPPDLLPLYAYVCFSVIVLLLWLFIVRVLPKPFGGMSWLAVFAVLLTPTMALGDTGDIAPANIAVVYGILMKDMGLALPNPLPILVVFAVGLFLGFIWQLIKGLIDKAVEKSRQQALLDEQAEREYAEEQLALASANYASVVDTNVGNEPDATLIKPKITLTSINYLKIKHYDR